MSASTWQPPQTALPLPPLDPPGGMPLDLAHLVLPGPSSTRHVVLERHRHALAAISGSDPRFADHVQLVDAARDALLQAVDERPPTR